MVQKHASKQDSTPKQKIRFTIIAPEASKVTVAGNFNAWDATCYSLKKKNNGKWERTLSLPPGAYEYKFIVDGRWRLDPNNDHACDNGLGTRNSVLVVRGD